jgi:antitoxin CptB
MNARRPFGIGDYPLDRDTRLKRLRFRSWHRGTREADYMVGGFFDRFSDGWSNDEIGWYERLMDEQDVDIIAWAIGTAAPPACFAGPMITAMQRLDYISIPQ